jgi:hypothetical protein
MTLPSSALASRNDGCFATTARSHCWPDRLAFFDLRDSMSARAYYGTALDSSREAHDPHLAAATLGHMSFIPAADGVLAWIHRGARLASA